MSKTNLPEKFLVMLSGPSCVGKGPLVKALMHNFPDLRVQRVILYYNREKRPVEKEGYDYYFRSRQDIEAMVRQEPDRYITIDLETGLQVLDLGDILESPEPIVLAELHFRFVRELQKRDEFLKSRDITWTTVLLSPVSEEEVAVLKARGIDLQEFLDDMMLAKLVRRAQNQGKPLTFAEMKDLKNRAHSAFHGLKRAHTFEHILVNHDGEDSDNWRLPYPVGDAGKTLENLVKILNRQEAEDEQWEKGLIE